MTFAFKYCCFFNLYRLSNPRSINLTTFYNAKVYKLIQYNTGTGANGQNQMDTYVDYPNIVCSQKPSVFTPTNIQQFEAKTVSYTKYTKTLYRQI